MATRPSSPESPEAPPETDDNVAEIPMSMHQSVALDQLPRDTHEALKTAGELELEKITVHLKNLPNTPPIPKHQKFKLSSNLRFEAIPAFIRKRLKEKVSAGLYCYVNSVFAPGLDESVGNLYRCFKTGDELVVHYSITQAFG